MPAAAAAAAARGVRPGVTDVRPRRRLTASLCCGTVPVRSMLVSVLRSQATRASLAVKPLAPQAEPGVREASEAQLQ
jgi:hypothetical protein